jgi:drug/metabolite transporter (DMT)-like permease
MCVIWGVPYYFIRIAVSELTPATLVFLRTGGAALILLPVAIARGGLRSLLPHWLPLAGFALVEIGIPWLLLATAEERLSSSLTGLLIAAVPLVGVLISIRLGTREGFGVGGTAGLLLGVAGVAAIVGLDLHATSIAALAEVGAVAVCYAVGPAILARYLAGLPALAVIAVSVALCTVAYAPVAAFQLPSAAPRAGVIASVVVLAVVCTALAFLLFFALIAEVGPVRATVITYVNPAVAAVLGVAALGERFTVGMGFGFVLVLVGSALATRRPRGHAESPEPQYS